MTTAIKRRRGTTTQHSTFTGLDGEITVDTTKETVVVHDGATAGGFPLLRQDLSNNTNVATLSGTQTFSGAKTFSSTITGSITGNAGTVTNGVYTSGDQTIGGVKTFSSNPIVNAGSVNGVAYLNGSKVLTTGSALTFDGANLGVSGNATLGWTGKLSFSYDTIGSYTKGLNSLSRGLEVFNYENDANGGIRFMLGTTASPSEGMRLTSTGLGIGTSSPALKLDVAGSAKFAGNYVSFNDNGYIRTDAANILRFQPGSGGYQFRNAGNSDNLAVLDSSGNLGLGVTPSAWSSASRPALQLPNGAALFSRSGSTILSQNIFYNSSDTGTYINNGFATLYNQISGQHQWFNAASGTAGNTASLTQLMTLDASGRLTLGTTVASSGFSSISLSGGPTGPNTGIQLNYNSGAFGGGAITTVNAAGGGLSFYTYTGNVGGESYSERARIDSSGNLLVGTTSGGSGNESGRLRLVGNTGGINGFYHQQTVAGGYTLISNAISNGGIFYHANFLQAGTSVGFITSTGSTTTYATSSDYRLKNITGPITTSGAYIDSLNPVEGTWKADGSTFVGLIAHEVQEASRTNVATGVKDGEEMQGMDYSSAEIIANLIAEVKSLRQRLAAAGI